MLKYPITMLKNHCMIVSGDVFAKVPRYSTIITWKINVAEITLTNTLLSHMPSTTSSFSISLELISLKSCIILQVQYDFLNDNKLRITMLTSR
ncbi:hypothetical protein Hanom_Chr07g00644381 [Helianthus anomalus]